MSSTARTTGRRTDTLRRAWAAIARRPALQRLDRAAHRAYAQWERVRHGAPLMADPGSLHSYLRVERRGASGGPVRVRIRPLGGATFELRPGTTDALSLRDTFRDRVHPPPPEAVRRGVHQIVDLGANIGATVAHNAVLHPQARILGVELNPDTAALARRNIAPWSDRCEILQGAVWVEDGEVPYVRDGRGNDEYRVPETPAPGVDVTRAMSMDTILGRLPADARVDYLKMDIEGVEARLLRGDAATWTARVETISLQVHDPYTIDDCRADLEALGFRTRVDLRRPNYIVGVRA